MSYCNRSKHFPNDREKNLTLIFVQKTLQDYEIGGKVMRRKTLRFLDIGEVF